MEAYHIERFGSIDGIVLQSSENPRPGRKEVLMRVRASLTIAISWSLRAPVAVRPRRDPCLTAPARSRRLAKGLFRRARIGGRIAGCFHLRWLAARLSVKYTPGRRQNYP